jgi:hypothetical protein
MRIFVYACVLKSTASAKKKKSRKAVFVTFSDYGSVDSIPLEQLLPLDQVCAIKLYGNLSSRCFKTLTKNILKQKREPLGPLFCKPARKILKPTQSWKTA